MGMIGSDGSFHYPFKANRRTIILAPKIDITQYTANQLDNILWFWKLERSFNYYGLTTIWASPHQQIHRVLR